MRLAAAGALLVALVGTAAGQENRGAPAGDFDLYVLALTWSPGFCAAGGDERAPDQCAPGRGFGFVVHGLWPQYERGFPTRCGPAGRQPTRSDMAAAARLFPDEGLARYQWRKHGSCSGLPPRAYFDAVARASAMVSRPDLSAGEASLRPIDVERAFASANRALRPDMTAVSCARDDRGRQVLSEVRVCLTKDLRAFRPCPSDVERRSCRSPAIAVPAAE